MESIQVELKQMLQNGVWKKEGTLNKLPDGQKGIGTKWVFKIKKNGVYRSQLVAKGYNQVAGIDFQYNFAPVINNTTFKVLLTIWLMKNYSAKLIDVKTAFLYRVLEEELFINMPEGYNIFLKEEYGMKMKEGYVTLEKTMYGLVQAAREWWKKFVKTLKEDLEFEQFTNNNCLLK